MMRGGDWLAGLNRLREDSQARHELVPINFGSITYIWISGISKMSFNRDFTGNHKNNELCVITLGSGLLTILFSQKRGTFEIP